VAEGPTSSPRNGKLTSQDEEVRRLRREVAQLREERDILGKPTAFVAKGARVEEHPNSSLGVLAHWRPSGSEIGQGVRATYRRDDLLAALRAPRSAGCVAPRAPRHAEATPALDAQIPVGLK
jgi:hypothetical protein